MPQRIATTHLGRLAGKHGYWQPCDGVVALDISGLDKASPAQAATLIEQLMAQPVLIDALRARAEYGFLLHIARLSSQASRPSIWLDIHWGRETPLLGRHGRLIEAYLFVASDIRPAGVPRS